MLTATLVSKKWNEIISNSQQFLKKTKFQVDFTKDYKTLNEMECAFNRKYQHVRVQTVDFKVLTPEIMNHMLELKNSCKVMSMERVVFPHQSFESVLDFLSQFESLEELEISTSLPSGNVSMLNVKPAIMPKLKVLKMERNSEWMFRNLICENLEVLSINTLFGATLFHSHEKPNEHLIKFLNQNRNIKKLNLSNLSLECQEELHPKFKWKELTIYHNELNNWRIFKNWRSLINAAVLHSKVIIESDIEKNSDFFLNFLNTAGQCENISRMRINLNHTVINRYSDFYNRLMPLKWINSLELHFTRDPRMYCVKSTGEVVDSFLQMFPNVEFLYLDCEASKLLNSENAFLFTKVKKLKLERATKYRPQDYLPALESIEIMSCATEDWQYILSAAPYKSVKIHIEVYDYKAIHDNLENVRIAMKRSYLPSTKKLEIVKKEYSPDEF